ncbi:MAG: protein translocase subunit SecD [Desulfatitalea sp.]|nr:protein translocase subunit SecD [Desulfatitalea sp.]NNK02823.1 protein translocase subunit SecD [Desulfatitalea sp.]
MKTLSWRPVVIAAVLLAAFVYVLPTLDMLVEKKDAPTLWPRKQINLGLDLKGGMHLVLQVDSDKAVENTVDRALNELRAFVRKNNIRIKGLTRVATTTLAVEFGDQEDFSSARGLVVDEFRDYSSETKALEGRQVLHLTLKAEEIKRIKKLAFEKAVMKVRNRVDEYGAREPDIRPQGEDRIIVQLPGEIDPEKARKEIGRTGNLEFKLVNDDNDVREALKGQVPAGSELRYYRKDDPEMAGRPILLKRQTLLSGDYLSEARVQFDHQTGQPFVAIKFNPKGARIFATVTEENINKRLAIVLDGEVYSAPVIKDKIVGEGVISGNFTDESARSLALVLREAFPTPVKILYEKQVGPSLGKDSIQKGLSSMLIGGLVVLLFMAVYYRGAGIIADIALMLNIVLIGGGLAALNATLTLPGIAGIILTIGMAVDANVLIFERIREELRLGKTARAALDAGYERATLTILDANVTTLVAALVLFQFGSGPVKGFAVTLSLGVISSLFTALILSRTLFELFIAQRRVKTLSI